MTKAQVEVIANELLGLSLTKDEAKALERPLNGLRHMVELIERVPLPYTAEPYITPGTGDRWLEAWPDSTSHRRTGGER